MEDEVEYSFLTQVEYEEALISEHITEATIYHADGQEGYNLRSRLVTPLKKPVAPSKKVVVLPKKGVVISKTLQKPAPSAIPDQVQIKFSWHELSFLDRLHYSFNPESEIQKLKIPFPLIEIMKNDAFKSSCQNPKFSQKIKILR